METETSAPVTTAAGEGLSALRAQVAALVIDWGHERRDEPFKLSSAGWSHDYVDGKRAIAVGSRLQLVGQAITEMASEVGVTFDAVGGLTMGADPISVAVAMTCNAKWFSVRKTVKSHGKQRRIEGTEIAPGTRVLLVDDVITTGGSIIDALDALEQEGGHVVLATTLVDRGDMAGPALEARGIKYRPLLTYKDIDIAPVGTDSP